MAVLTFNLFYKRYGIRNAQTFNSVVMHSLKELSLPKSSLYHHATFDGVALCPNIDEYVFNMQKKPIQMQPISTMKSSMGLSRKVIINENELNRECLAKNKRLRIMHSLDMAFRDPDTLAMYNYNYLNKSYKYSRAIFTDYFKWMDIFKTMMEQAANIAERCNYNQFIVASAPTILPGVGQLTASEKILSQTNLKIFHEPNSYLLLEIWRWLSKDSSQSVISIISKNKLHLINLIFIENTRWCVFNLGYLEAFRKKMNDDEFVSIIKVDDEYAPESLQKRFLRFMMRVMEARTATANTTDEADAFIDSGDFDSADEANQNHQEQTQYADSDSTNVQSLEEIDKIDDDTVLELTEEEKIAKKIQEEQELDQELSSLDDIAVRKTLDENNDGVVSISEITQAPEVTHVEGIMHACDKLDNAGLITVREYNRFQTLAQTYKTAKNPYDGSSTVEEFINVTPEMLAISNQKHPDSDTIIDKSMLNDTLSEFDSKYINTVLKREVVSVVLSLQKAGIIVSEHSVERKGSITGEYEDHTVKIIPVVGAPSTLKFKLPTIDESGIMRTNGVNYRIKKLRTDLPIRKIAPDKVALTSYYGKLFVHRGRKRIYDYGAWLRNEIMVKAMDDKDNDIHNVIPTPAFNPDIKAPRSYTAMAMGFRQMVVKGFQIQLDQRIIEKAYDKAYLKKQTKLGNIVMGANENGAILLIDKLGGVFSEYNNELTQYGSLEQFLNVRIENSPVEFAELTVFGKEVPVGIILSYYLGFSNLLKALNIEPRRIEAGRRAQLSMTEWSLVFADETLVFNRDDKLAAMILGGFKDYHKTIRMFSVYSFDKPAVYLNILESNKLSQRYLREIDLLNQMFIDPITKTLLEKLNEPKTFQGLLIRATEMLLHDNHKHELDASEQCVRGYERIAGSIYTEIIQSIRQHNAQLGKSNKRVEMNPYAVSKRIMEDPAKEQISEINPLKYLREQEAITFSGEGGRSKQSMVKSTRIYHPNDMGLISESTVDSGDVAINTFTPASPKLNSLRGTADRFDFQTDGVSSLLSTSTLCAPGSDRDDPKRVNFVAIQQAHTVSCEGYHAPTIRTGQEEIIPHRVGDLFCYTAKKNGKIVDLTPRTIVVEYEDGDRKGVQIGKRFGAAAGLIIPHVVVSDLKLNDTVSRGDAIAYNKGFFEQDIFNPKRVVMKNYLTTPTVLWENDVTFEDASEIADFVADKLETHITKIKNIKVNFTDAVKLLVKETDKVNYDTVLCVIQDKVTSDAGMFTDETIHTLKIMDNHTPKAGVKGIVDKIEIYYHGDLEDMSDSLIDIATKSDKSLRQQAKELGAPQYTGQVDTSFRIDGEALPLDYAVIRIYITSPVPMGIGDKGVFFNQMKTVVSGNVPKGMRTEFGVELGASFGALSIEKRIVLSPNIIGTTNTLLKLTRKKMLEKYFG